MDYSSRNLHNTAVSRNLGQRIRARRRDLRLTQRQLADLAGVAERTVIAAEAGRPGLRVGHLAQILGVLGLDLRAVRSGDRLADGD